MANQILKFADTATNLPTQSEYAADPARNAGNVPGLASSKLVNKVLRQCAFISNAFAEYIVARTGLDVLDDNDTTGLVAKIVQAFTFEFVNDNFLINSNFDFWQRNTSFAVSVTNTYTADRWVDVLTGSTATISRQATAGTEAFLAKYFLRAAVTSSAGVSNFNQLQQRIEDVRTMVGKTITVSFYAKADSARNMSIEMFQNFGTGGSPSADVNTLGVQKFALTTSWQKFTKTLTIPSISGKVLGTNDDSYTGLIFWFDAGTNYNSRTNSLGQQSGTFDIAQVKVESGSQATAFVLAGYNQGTELQLCQRYYEKSYKHDVAIGTVTDVSSYYTYNVTGTTTAQFPTIPYGVSKRALPTVTIYNPTSGASGSWQATSPAETYAGTVQNNALKNFTLQFASVVGGRLIRGHFTADAEL